MADVVTLGSCCEEHVVARSIAFRAARTRSTAIGRLYRGDVGSPVPSSIDRPATPVATHRVTLSATSAGSSPYPDMKSALTGRSTAAVILAMSARVRSPLTAPARTRSRRWSLPEPGILGAEGTVRSPHPKDSDHETSSLVQPAKGSASRRQSGLRGGVTRARNETRHRR